MAFSYLTDGRVLNIRASVVNALGTSQTYSADDILNYRFTEDSADTGFALGCAPAASFSIVLANDTHSISPLTLQGGIVDVDIGISFDNGDSFTWSDFGVWKIESVSVSNQSATATLTGYDALYTGFDTAFEDNDGNYPRTIGELAQSVCNAVGIVLKTNTFLNSEVSIGTIPSWDEDVSYRGVIGFIAACAGGFARISRDGELEFVQYNSQETNSVSENDFFTLELTSVLKFQFNRLQVKMTGDEDYTEYAIDANLGATATNTIQVTDNPLFTDAVANTVLNALNGFESYGCTLEWRGDPSSLTGKILTVTDTDGLSYSFVVNSQSVMFSGGLHFTSYAVLSEDTGNSTGYSANASAITATGKLNGAAIAADSIKAGTLAAGSVSAENIQANTISAEKIQAGAISASKLDAESVNAFVLTAVRADIRKLAAEEITTDQLYADLATIAAACITTANIQKANIDWAQIENLTSAIASIAKAQITTANIGEANIEWAEIENLSAFIITTAKAQITTANIDQANIDWAQVSTLMAEVATVAKAQITTANINQANIDWASIATLSAVMADIADARIGSATISTAQIDQLDAEVARILSVQIATGEFDFASVQNLVASAMVLEQGTGGSIYITNLAVTSATILSATMGELVVQGEDGKYYEITVMTDGTIATKEVTVTEGEIAAGETAGGKGIVATTANVAELNAQTVKANSAIISEILVGALTAEKITAQQALIASATVPELYATSIKAIGDSLDLSSNQSIRLYVAEEIEDVHVGSRNYIRNSRDFDCGDYGVVTRETSGVWQEGDTLVIVSGVTVAQDGGVLQIS